MKKEQEFVTVLQGKPLREFAQRLVNGKFTIEKVTLNRYKVIENNGYTLINRRTFVLLDTELYRLQARENPLAAGIKKALDNNALQFYVRKDSVDALSAKLIVKTFAQAKVTLENVATYRDNYIIRFALVESISERLLTEKEQAIVNLFQSAKEVAPSETLVLPTPETPAAADTTDTIKEVPAK